MSYPLLGAVEKRFAQSPGATEEHCYMKNIPVRNSPSAAQKSKAAHAAQLFSDARTDGDLSATRPW
jgi:hypothetical protein